MSQLPLVVCGDVTPALAVAETPSSPYQLRWSSPDDDLSAIDVDRGDLSKSRFETAYELVKYLSTLKPVKKKPKPPSHGGPPARNDKPSKGRAPRRADGRGKGRRKEREVAKGICRHSCRPAVWTAKLLPEKGTTNCSHGA